MTTTGDLFVNIKGNNQGLKRSLNQSNRDLQNFSRKAEQTFGGKGNALGNAFQGVTAAAALFGTGAYDRFKGITGAGHSKRRALLFGLTHSKDEVEQRRAHVTRVLRNENHPKHREYWRKARGKDGSMPSERFNVMDRGTQMRSQISNVLGIMATMPGAVAAVAAGVFAADATKQSKRINDAAAQFSGTVIGYQARLDAANMRKDIRLARNPYLAGSAKMRAGAADFRMNSGMAGNGLLGNIGGSAWDVGIGIASNALYGIPGMVNNIMQISNAVGGPK